ncbi:MAG: AraC family transcriptional regulator [Eubacteriales bacterium]
MIPFYEKIPSTLRGGIAKLSSFPPHLHLDLELIYVINGSMNLSIGTDYIKLQQHELAIIFPNTIHSYFDNDNDSTVIMLICGQDLLGEYSNRLLKYSPQIPILHKEKIHKDVSYAIYSLLDEITQSEKNLSAQSALTELILSRTLPYLDLYKNTIILEGEITSKLIAYICDNFTKPLSLDFLSTELGINKYYISRVFTNKIKVSFNDYMNSLRINYSKELLTTTSLSILDISNMCGFETQRTFNRIFKNITNTSPLKYRNKNQEQL